MKARIIVEFDLDSEDADFIMSNVTKLVQERLNRWPMDVSDVKIEAELG